MSDDSSLSPRLQSTLPISIVRQLQDLDLELSEGDITRQGYEKRRQRLLAPFMAGSANRSSFGSPTLSVDRLSLQRNSPKMSETESNESPVSPTALMQVPVPPPALSQRPSPQWDANAWSEESAEQYRNNVVPKVKGYPEQDEMEGNATSASNAPQFYEMVEPNQIQPQHLAYARIVPNPASYSYDYYDETQSNNYEYSSPTGYNSNTMITHNVRQFPVPVSFTADHAMAQGLQITGTLRRGSSMRRAQKSNVQAAIPLSNPTFISPPLTLYQGVSMPYPPLVDPSSHQRLDHFTSIVGILRYRAHSQPKNVALIALDAKGKAQGSLTFEKWNQRAEKLASYLKEHIKSAAHPPVKNQPALTVALLFKRENALEFSVALMGCIYAGCLAVPFVAGVDRNELEDLQHLLHMTRIGLILTTDAIQKTLAPHLKRYPALSVVPWKCTNLMDLESSKKRSVEEMIYCNAMDLVYLDVHVSLAGEMKAIMVRHLQLLKQMERIHGMTGLGQPFLSLLDARQGLGLLLVYYAIYTGQALSILPKFQEAMISLHIWTKYDVGWMDISHVRQWDDYLHGSTSPNNASQDRKKQIDLSHLKSIYISITVNEESLLSRVAETLYLAYKVAPDRVLSLGTDEESELDEANLSRNQIFIPVWSAWEWAGWVFAVRTTRTVPVLYWDRERMSMNQVELVRKSSKNLENQAVMMTSIGSLPESIQVCIVDPDSCTPLPPGWIGEIWIQDELFQNSSGFFGNSSLTEFSFNAILSSTEDNPYRFLRSSYMGFMYQDQVFIVGHLFDQVRQERRRLEPNGITFDMRFYFGREVADRFMLWNRMISAAAVFSMDINEQELMIAILEVERWDQSNVMSMQSWMETMGISFFMILYCQNESLPRQARDRFLLDGEPCRAAFETGQLHPLGVQVKASSYFVSAPVTLPSQLPVDSQAQFMGSDVYSDIMEQSRALNRMNLASLLLFRGTFQPDSIALTCISDLKLPLRQESFTYLQLVQRAYAIQLFLEKKFQSMKWHPLDSLQNQANKTQIPAIAVMMTGGVEYICTLYACAMMGVAPLIVPVPDANHSQEDLSLFSILLTEIPLKVILVHSVSESILTAKWIQTHLKKSHLTLPSLMNVSKASVSSSFKKEMISSITLKENKILCYWCHFKEDGTRTITAQSHAHLLHCSLQIMDQSVVRESGFPCVTMNIWYGLGFTLHVIHALLSGSTCLYWENGVLNSSFFEWMDSTQMKQVHFTCQAMDAFLSTFFSTNFFFYNLFSSNNVCPLVIRALDRLGFDHSLLVNG